MHELRHKLSSGRWAALVVGGMLLVGVLGTATVLHGRPNDPARVVSGFST